MINNINPALCYGVCTKQDQGHNFYGFIGAEIFKKEKGIVFDEYQYVHNDDYNIRTLRSAAKKGNNPIVCIASEYKEALRVIAEEFPEIHFVLLHAILDLPNVQSIMFNTFEGTFLAGMAAGLTTKSNIIGVSLMDFAWTHREIAGFLQGIQFVNKDAKWIETTIDGNILKLYDCDTSYTVASDQIASGADVIFCPLCKASVGALEAAKAAGKFYIGAHMNQNHIYPGIGLTSWIFRLDKVVYDIFLESALGQWKPGVKYLTAKDGIFEWALDRFNRDLIPAEIAAKINQAKADIIHGTLKVAGPAADNKGAPRKTLISQ